MTGWIAAGCVLLALTALGLLPLGVDAAYEAGGFRLHLRAGPVAIAVYPREKKEKKPKKPRGKGEAAPEDEAPADKKKPRPSGPMIKALIARGYEALCRLVRRVRVDVLRLHFTAAGADPYSGAMAYGAAGLAMEGLLRAADGRIAHPDLRADVDFDLEKPKISGQIRLTVRLHRLLGIGIGFGIGVLKDRRALKKGKEA